MKIDFKNTVKTLTALLLVAGMVVTGCKKKSDDDDDNITPTPTPTDTCGTLAMGFLANGHILTYDLSIFGGMPFLMTHTMTTYPGGKIRTVLSSSTLNDTLYSKECGGWLYRAAISDTLRSENKYRKSTTAVGDIWSFSEGGTSAVYTVLAKNVSVTTPAGTFVCDKIKYEQNGTLNVDTIYFNNAVGDVKYSGALIDYTLKTKNF